MPEPNNSSRISHRENNSDVEDEFSLMMQVLRELHQAIDVESDDGNASRSKNGILASTTVEMFLKLHPEKEAKINDLVGKMVCQLDGFDTFPEQLDQKISDVDSASGTLKRSAIELQRAQRDLERDVQRAYESLGIEFGVREREYVKGKLADVGLLGKRLPGSLDSVHLGPRWDILRRIYNWFSHVVDLTSESDLESDGSQQPRRQSIKNKQEPAQLKAAQLACGVEGCRIVLNADTFPPNEGSMASDLPSSQSLTSFPTSLEGYMPTDPFPPPTIPSHTGGSWEILESNFL